MRITIDSEHLKDILRLNKFLTMKNIFLSILFVVVFSITSFSCSSQKNIKQSDPNDSFTLLKAMMDKTLPLPNGKPRYSKYDDKIIIQKIEDNYIFHYRYNEASYQIRISDKSYPDYISLFEDGRLHPKVIRCSNGTEIYVGQFEEKPTASDQVRHYTFWCWVSRVMNPCEYTIELINESAEASTSTKDFVQNATVAFISPCGIIM